MDKAVQPAQVDEEAKVGDLADTSGANLAGLQFIQHTPATGRPPFLGSSKLGK